MVSVLINYVSIIVHTMAPSVVMIMNVIVAIPNSSWLMILKMIVIQPPKSGGVNLFIVDKAFY
jgi:hypothetical protein